jgi:mono/diheme cytochrome c family protein
MVLALLAACDDTLFANGAGAVGESYADVQQVLAEHCVACHQAGGEVPDLRTDPCGALVRVSSETYGALYVDPGNPANSLLWTRMANTGAFDASVMPPSGQVEAAGIATVEAWVARGATCSPTTDADSGEAGVVP